jgi:CheY-like chemotaxis protein
VLCNLVTNAIKFTDAGGRVVLRLSSDDTTARMTVTDSGVGIAAPLLPFVFDRFRQGDGSTTRRHGGLGLGLAIVRHIVELHGGRVTAASDGDGKGAVFEVLLSKCVPADEARPAALSSGAARPAADRARLDGVRVLVVDDDHDARELLQTILAHTGARVRTAESAAEAMAALAEERFDVLVSDIAMPDEDGYALIRRVRALPRDAGGAMAAVAVTAFAHAQDRMRALAAGFTSWVSKPIHGDELLATVEGLASLGRSRPRL